MIACQSTHAITLDDARAWLDEHGLNINDVTEATITVGRPPAGQEISAWLDVTWYKRNDDGNRYPDETGDCAATGHSTIPLTSFPRLTTTG